MAGTKRGMPFERTGPFPIDDKFVLSNEEMLAVDDQKMPEKYFAVNTDDGKFYLYDKSATASAETGKYSVLEGGGGGGSTVLEPSRNAGELLGMKAVDGDKELRVFADGQVIVIDGADSKSVNLATQDALDAKQDTLESGTNIKTVAGESLLGSGDIPIPTYVGSGWGVAKNGTATLTFDQSTTSSVVVSIADLGLADANYYVAVSGNLVGLWVNSKTSSNFRINGTLASQSSVSRSVEYTVFAKGYGGVPNGGTTGQVLAKKSDADGDTEWVTGGGGETPTLDAVLKKGNSTERSAIFTDELNGTQAEIYANGTYMTGNGTEGMRQFSVSQNGIRAVDNLVGTITPKFVVPFEPSGEDQVAMSAAVKASFRNALDMPTLVTQTQQTPGQPITATLTDGDNEIRFDVAGGTIQMDFTDANATNTKFLATQGYVDDAVGDLDTLTTTDKSSAVGAINELDAAVKGLGEPFRVKNWASNTLNVEIPYCTEDLANSAIAKMTYSIDAVEGADYQIVGMIAYEVFDAASGGNRINCFPVCQFTGNGQKELSVRWACMGTTRKTAKRINAWVLLKHR